MKSWNDPYFSKILEMAAVDQPLEPPTRAQWDALEASLGVALPLDFKALVSRLGTGGFGELCLLNPATSNEFIRFDRGKVEFFNRAIGPIARMASFVLYPEPGGFLVVGMGDRLDLLLQPQTSSAAHCPLMWLDEDLRQINHFNMSIAHFLHDLYIGLLPVSWAQETRDLLWGPGEALFTA